MIFVIIIKATAVTNDNVVRSLSLPLLLLLVRIRPFSHTLPSFITLFIVWRLSCSLIWPQTHSVARNDLDLLICVSHDGITGQCEGTWLLHLVMSSRTQAPGVLGLTSRWQHFTVINGHKKYSSA